MLARARPALFFCSHRACRVGRAPGAACVCLLRRVGPRLSDRRPAGGAAMQPASDDELHTTEMASTARAPIDDAGAFRGLFGVEPRPVQLGAMRFLAAQPLSAISVAELDTGAGKSNIGIWRMCAALDAGVPAAVYACSTCDLQTQVARCMRRCADARVRGARVMFGRAQYWCPRRARHALEAGRVSEPTRGFIAEHVLPFDPRAAPEDAWAVPMRRRFEAMCRARGVDAAEWQHISAAACDCFDEAKKRLGAGEELAAVVDCPRGYAWLRLRAARVKVVNTAYLFALLGRGAGGALTGGDPFYAVFDEAHLLCEHAQHLCAPGSVPDRFDLRRAAEIVRRWRERGEGGFVRGELVPPPGGGGGGGGGGPRLAFADRELRDAVDRVRVDGGDQARLGALLGELVAHREAVGALRQSAAWPDEAAYRRAAHAAVPAVAEALLRRVPFADGDGRTRERACREAERLLVLGAAERGGDAGVGARVRRLAEREGDLAEWVALCRDALYVLGGVATAQEAVRRERWLRGAFRLVVPSAGAPGAGGALEYAPSQRMLADALRDAVWAATHHVRGALLMSATLRNAALRAGDPFDTFARAVGLDGVAGARLATFAGARAFDRARTVIAAPEMATFEYREEAARPELRARRLDEAADELAHAVRLNPRSTIVVSPSRLELDEIRRRLERALPDVLHVDAYDAGAFEAFRRGDARAVLYGCDGLGTGVDLPGRLGLVVATRPLNRADQLGMEYECSCLLRGDEFWELLRFQRLQRTLQLAGRLQRCDADRGVFLLLSDRRGSGSDAELVRRHYQTDRPVKRARLGVTAADVAG